MNSTHTYNNNVNTHKELQLFSHMGGIDVLDKYHEHFEFMDSHPFDRDFVKSTTQIIAFTSANSVKSSFKENFVAAIYSLVGPELNRRPVKLKVYLTKFHSEFCNHAHFEVVIRTGCLLSGLIDYNLRSESDYNKLLDLMLYLSSEYNVTIEKIIF